MASKSLGTLTLDLVAKIGAFTGPLDQASQAAKKRNAEMAKSFDNLAKGVGVAIGSIPAVLTAMVVSSANAAKEIATQASLAGLGTTEFQKYAAGARTVGVEQDKLSDIFKDTNDKIGDFLSTGGGELQNFFTNIAPKVGVTADQFKKLNSKDALALYVTSLEKANVNQQEMTFYMEAIANDSTALVPLLRNNGKAFEEMGKAALDAGVVMDETTIAAAKQFGIELSGLGQYLTSAKTMLAAEFLPVLAKFTKDVNLSAKEAGGLKGQVGELGQELVKVTAFIVSAGDGVVRVFDIAANTLVGMYATAVAHLSSLMSDVAKGIGAITFGETSDQFIADSARLRDEASSNFNIAAQAASGINEALLEPLAGEKFKKYVADAKAAADEVSKSFRTTTPGTGSNIDPNAAKERTAAAKKAASEAAAAAKKIQESFNSTETDYQRQIALINTSADAQKNATEVDKLRFEIVSGKLVGINGQQQERLKALAAELDTLEKLKTANEEAIKLASFAANLKDSNQTVRQGFEVELAGAGTGDKLKERLKADLEIQQDYNRQAADLQKQLNAGDIEQELYDKQTVMLSEALAERMVLQEDYYNRLDEAQSNWMDGVSDAWQNYVDAAQDYSGQAADATTSVLDGAQTGLSTFLSDVGTGAETAGDALGNLVADFATSTVDALTDMAAQWLVYQAVQLLVGKTTQASAIPALVANAQATAFQASLAAYASTAAIPIIGPAAAPAAAALAAATTAPMVAGVASAAMAGMAHDGIDAVPETGTWLLQKGERVTTAETSAKLDRTLDRVNSSNSGPSASTPIVINAPVTVQGQPGMSNADAARQGGAISSAIEQQFGQFLDREMRQGGRLWRRNG